MTQRDGTSDKFIQLAKRVNGFHLRSSQQQLNASTDDCITVHTALSERYASGVSGCTSRREMRGFPRNVIKVLL